MASKRRQPRLQLPGARLTANEEFFDAMIRHQIGLLRMSKGLGRRVRELLDATERDLRSAISNKLRRVFATRGRGIRTPESVRQLQRVLKEVQKIRREAHRKVAVLFEQEMMALALAEPAFIAGIMKTVLPVFLTSKLPPPELLRSIVRTRPFEGKVMRAWAKSIERVDLDRIETQIKIGLTQGESIPEISRRVVGTVKLRGVNGVTEITRRNAEALARTSVNAIANEARREFHLANADILDDELYVATLDAVTTPICRSLDGERFPLGVGPIPPLHFGCRSLRTAILDAIALGRRPSKPVHERGLLREFAKRENLSSVPRTRGQLPHGTKGVFDDFARVRTRELIGTVPAKVNYQQWLGRQSAAFQDDVLGRTKGALFRRGGLTLDKFVDPVTFSEVTLASLARSEAAAFRAIGLDPEDFL